MVHLKTEKEIETMREGGALLMKVMEELLPHVKEGVTTQKIDTTADALIHKVGGSSSFKRVPGYRWSTCLPVNEQVVHTPPSSRILKQSDILTIDIGMFYKGLHTDYATTVVVGNVATPEVLQFLKIGEETLKKAIPLAKAGNYIGQISELVQHDIYANGYFILKELTGHGVGRDLHEDPYVPNYLDRPVEKTYKIKPGLVVAIEVIYSMGTEKIAYERGDDWSIRTKDNSLSACFEKSVAVTAENTCILT